MSELVQHGYYEAAAISYNAKSADKLGFVGDIPQPLLDLFPDMAKDPRATGDVADDGEDDRRDFALAVLALQIHLGYEGEDRDGKLGKGTWSKAVKKFDHVADDQEYVIVGDRRRILHVDAHTKITCYDEKGGIDMHRHGDFTKQAFDKPERLVFLHWGGHDAKGCARVLADRGLSSNGGFDPGGLFQFIDLKHATWHAGKVKVDFDEDGVVDKKVSMNLPSVGFDICQQPTVNYLSKYTKRGYDCVAVPNGTDRGDKKVITLDSRTAHHVRQIIPEVCRLLNIPFQFPSSPTSFSPVGTHEVYHGVMDDNFLASDECTGVLGHHHVSKSKWDIAPWWSQIFDEQPVA